MGFDERAKSWDSSERRQALAEAVANAIKSTIELNSSMHLLDIGAGTGLLTRRVLPSVDKITAIDTSSGMLSELEKSVKGNVEICQTDIMEYKPSKEFDGIISSMTMHHIEDIETLFKHLYKLLKPGGFIALADLAPEDGTFHTNGNDGVFHFGFAEDLLNKYAKSAGFKGISYKIVHKVEKPKNSYDIFLITAQKVD